MATHSSSSVHACTTSPPSPRCKSARPTPIRPLGEPSIGHRRPSKKRKSDERRDSSLLGIAKTTKPFVDHRAAPATAQKSRHKPMKDQETDESIVIIDQSLGLEKSLPRRRSWTPVESSGPAECSLNDSATTLSPGAQGYSAVATFGALSDTYGYKQASKPTLTSNLRVEGSSATTRSRVELVAEAVHQTSDTTLDRVPVPKKRPRTITEKATELFRQEIGARENIEIAESSAPRDAEPLVSSTKTKRKSKRKLKASNMSVGPPLLTPEEARQVLLTQDLIFGTSSQLAREDSPTTIADVQKAIAVSLETISESSGSNRTSAATSQSSVQLSSVGSYTSSKNLWEAASRDLNGCTVLPEVIDLTEPPRGIGGLNLQASPTLLGMEAPFADPFPVARCGHTSQLLSTVLPTGSVEQSHPTAAHQDGPPRKEVNDTGNVSILHEPSENAKNRLEAMPDYSTWSDSELKKAIKSYGFRAMRNRKNMVLKLEQCWRSLHEPSIRHATNIAQPAPKAVSLAESALASASASGTAQPDAPEADPGPIIGNGPGSTSTITDHAQLYAKIQEAIVTCPPTRDPTHLSWYEKILMFDPIVIEDLTAWLNSGQLSRVGVDEEVRPALVREWCESQSICCIWKLTLRGGVRRGARP